MTAASRRPWSVEDVGAACVVNINGQKAAHENPALSTTFRPVRPLGN